jgi:hypothetical protein
MDLLVDNPGSDKKGDGDNELKDNQRFSDEHIFQGRDFLRLQDLVGFEGGEKEGRENP